MTHPLKTRALRSMYRAVGKPLFFRCDPESVHDAVTVMGRFLGATAAGRGVTKALFGYADPLLRQTVAGIDFPNPIGLAAGFDKNAELTNIIPAVGFGAEEIGSVTALPCPGNVRPRLWRLKASKSLLVYYGLKNDGAERVLARLRGRRFAVPVGVSIAKTNVRDVVTEEQGIADYVRSFELFTRAGVGDWYTVNISCPNTFGGEPFTDPAKLDRLLTALRRVPCTRPVFLKMPAELSLPEVDRIVEVARRHGVAGFISSNLAKSRTNANICDAGFPDVGGMSGKVVEDLSNAQVAHLYRTCGREFVIVGCGGVFSAEDAYKKIRLGASLVQMITGMIFEGPQVIGEINRGLVELLRRDGFSDVSQAVGAEWRKGTA